MFGNLLIFVPRLIVLIINYLMRKTFQALVAFLGLSSFVAVAQTQYTNSAVSVYWPMSAVDKLDAEIQPQEVVSMANINVGDLTLTGTGSCTDANAQTVAGVTLIKFKPAGSTTQVEWSLKPASGLTFTPTKVSGYCNRYGTDAENSVVLSLGLENGKTETIATYSALRNGKTSAQKPYDATAVHYFEITLNADQQQALTTSGILTLSGKVGVGNTKELGYGQVRVEGIVNGTLAQVDKFTLSAAVNDEKAGSVAVSPKASEYEAGTEVTLTATENFGYDFVNWTNENGEVVGTAPKLVYKVETNVVLTANFKQVNTYALNMQVEGGANDYMISYNPAPVVVEGRQMYEAGTKVVITASENPILTFNNWSNGLTEKEIVQNMDADVSLTANYSAIDFLTGWDFICPGNNGRKADFFAAENDAVSLVLRDAEGNNYGWLDKSLQGAGGYEGRPAAVNWVNSKPIGTTYWETKVNASAFTALKLITAMVYNYNAYKTYLVEASTNGTEWTKIGEIKMSGAKNWADATLALPASFDNQAEVSIRWIADKTSAIDGTSSANDGAALGATYIIGTAKLVDDGTAPTLVSTVPVEGASNASANGKIVLTFDEKVKVTEGVKATLAGVELLPVVSGKTVSFEYKGLEYSTQYTFTLPANSVADLTDNFVKEAISIQFTTKVKPAVQKELFDVIVGDGNELAAAIKAANGRKDQSTRYRIFVKKGAHVLPTNGGTTTGGDGKTYDDPRTYMTGSNISIIGEDYETTSFTNITPAATWDNGYGPSCPLEGIGNADVLINSGTNNYFQGVTIRTSMGDAHGRDIAFQDKGNKTIFKNARLWGYQDTYVSNSNRSRYYFENGVIRGRTDYICGKGDVWYEQVTFQQVAGGYLAVPSQPTKYGYIINKCVIKGESGADGKYTLGRPWGSGTPIALYLNCVFEAVPSAEGWSEMSGGWPARMAEYNSVTKSGTTIDLSRRKTSFGNETNGYHTNNPVLTAVEASEYTIAKVMGEGDNWDPTALTEQASAPKGVLLNGTQLVWDNSDYVLCWAVCKNGTVVDFTIEPKYTVDDVNANWSVRAANEMGGLGEASVASTSNAIKTLSAPVAESAVYDLMGRRVNETKAGQIYLKAGKRYMQK